MKSIPIYLFMDAMGWEIVQNYHFLESELPFRYPVQMQFGYSSTAIPTILIISINFLLMEACYMYAFVL